MPSTVGIVASGEDVLNDAVFWIDAGRSSVSSGALTNLGTGGSALNAVFGNSTGTDSFDPALLTHTGTNHLYLPGVAANYASRAADPALNITGDIEIVCRVALTDWTPATEKMLVSRWDSPSSQRCFILRISTSGIPYLTWSADGTTGLSAIPSGGPAFVDGTTYWLKATLDVDNGAAGSTARYYYADDSATEPTVWTQWGANVVTAGVTSLFASSTAALEVGAFNNGSAGMATGKFYRAIVRNGIGGTTVFDADFTTGITSGGQTTFTESSANAATVTINRATSGRKSVAVVRPILLFGTDDFMEVSADPEGAYLQTSGVAGQYASSPYVSADTGTATSGTTTTLTDTAKAWTSSLFVGRQVRITGGTGVGQSGIITANTATQLTVGVAWAVAPDATSTYVVESAFQVTGDLEIVVRVNLTDWTPATENMLVSRWDSPSSQRCFILRISTSGIPYLTWSADGTTGLSAIPSGGPAFVDGITYWLKATLDVDNGAAGRTARFYYAADSATEPTSWTQWGTDVTAAGVTSLYASSSAALEVGSFNNGFSGMLTGNAYRAIVRRGIGGTTVADWAAYGHPANAGTFGDANLNVWTINGGTLRNANRLNFGASDSFTVIAVQRVWSTQSTARALIAKKADLTAATQGWALSSGSTTALQGQMQVGDGTNGVTAVSASRTAGTLQIVTAVRNITADTVTTWLNNTAGTSITDTTTISSANAEVMRVGRLSGAGTGYADMELVSAAVWSRALNANEIATIVNRYT